MKILSCKSQHGAYLELTLADGQMYSVHREIAADYGLYSLTEIDKDTLERMLFDNDVRRAYQRALYLLDGQGYSYQMLFQKLARNYNEEVCYEVLDRLAAQGFINDWKYAEQAARRAAEGKRYGPRRIRQILYQKGIPAAVIDKALLPYMDEDFQLENLAYILEKKYSRLLTDPSDRQKTEKCKAALARLGYGYSVIQEAVRIWFEDADSEE
ncbi:MAG: RecX family transcriptional regulator [Ruminococcus sp.]|nr:RecX family transcriptional regulator [Ruminococcus sp.]